MKIHKIGHSCFVLEEAGTRILTDPGQFTSQNLEHEDMVRLRDIDAVLVTHVHPDHLNTDSLEVVMKNNPGLQVIGNNEVHDLLSGIQVKVVEDKEDFSVGDFEIQAFETNHALIHKSMPVVRNTGFLFNKSVYHPGDALFVPPHDVDLLGLPIGAPWASIGELVDYAREVKPKKITPSHDGLLKELGPFQYILTKALEDLGVEFIPLRPGEEIII